ncbi:hypothetical protein COB21_04315 [Candidatus Aerophobetes bacterium]|uniref:Uncharacterized protein n=1 Tax=Aerophobetes bacterium TaxID=2030807 RepID=A0A2A4X1P6_UNCAE|nr:MAG: hypothetical protein COB21_04315 [Candidatus Aerophobetes bacterium]
MAAVVVPLAAISFAIQVKWAMTNSNASLLTKNVAKAALGSFAVLGLADLVTRIQFRTRQVTINANANIWHITQQIESVRLCMSQIPGLKHLDKSSAEEIFAVLNTMPSNPNVTHLNFSKLELHSFSPFLLSTITTKFPNLKQLDLRAPTLILSQKHLTILETVACKLNISINTTYRTRV